MRPLDVSSFIRRETTAETGAERHTIVDLIKINTARQESHHKEMEEQKHRRVALLGSIDGA